MMKKTNLVLLGIMALVSTFFYACETIEKIDDFPIVEPQLVLNCMFSPDSTWEFQVSRSLSVLDNADIYLIDNAKINLYVDGQKIFTTTEKNSNSYYISTQNLPQSGQTYKIEVSANNYKTITAENKIPAKVNIYDVKKNIKDSNTYYSSYYEKIMGDLTGSLGIVIDDPAYEENYYMLSIMAIDTYNFEDWNGDTISRAATYYVYDDENAVTEAVNDKAYIFSDNFFNGQKFQFNADIEDWLYYPDKKYTVLLYSLSREAYLYYLSLALYDQSQENPLTEPVQVYSNVENGFGIFGGYMVDKREISF